MPIEGLECIDRTFHYSRCKRWMQIFVSFTSFLRLCQRSSFVCVIDINATKYKTAYVVKKQTSKRDFRSLSLQLWFRWCNWHCMLSLFHYFFRKKADVTACGMTSATSSCIGFLRMSHDESDFFIGISGIKVTQSAIRTTERCQWIFSSKQRSIYRDL